MNAANNHASFRLKEARIAAGYGSASEAARALRVARATYLQHENGTRRMKVETFDGYLEFFTAQREQV